MALAVAVAVFTEAEVLALGISQSDGRQKVPGWPVLRFVPGSNFIS